MTIKHRNYFLSFLQFRGAKVTWGLNCNSSVQYCQSMKLKVYLACPGMQHKNLEGASPAGLWRDVLSGRRQNWYMTPGYLFWVVLPENYPLNCAWALPSRQWLPSVPEQIQGEKGSLSVGDHKLSSWTLSERADVLPILTLDQAVYLDGPKGIFFQPSHTETENSFLWGRTWN